MNAEEFCHQFTEVWSKPAHVSIQLLQQDGLFNKIPLAKQQELIELAEKTGKDQASWLQQHPEKLQELVSHITIESLTPAKNDQSFYVFGEYKQNHVILLDDSLLEDAQSFLETHQLLTVLEGTNIRDLVLMHELFHAIEYQQALWTIQKHLTYQIACFTKRARIYALSEIAAASFVQAYFRLKNSPVLLDSCVIYSRNPDLAQKILADCR